MRILHVINSLATGGAEKLILESIPRYNASGLHVDVLLLNGSPSPFLDELRKTECCRIFMLGTSSPYQLKHIFHIIFYLKNYDLVHAHLFPANYFVVAAKIFSFSRVPIIMTEHNTSNRRFRNKFFQLINRFVYSFFNKIICITTEVKDVVMACTKFGSKKFAVIHNGVDVAKYASAQPLLAEEIHFSLRREDFLLVQVSSFREQKDHETLIRAICQLPDSVKLLLAGEGPLLSETNELVRNLKLENRVFFLGVRSDIPSLLKTCNAVVLSSKYEGLSLASIEAMASGRPLIASDVPGLTEVVGGAGILFPQGDDRSLATEVARLMNDELHYAHVGSSCAERAQYYDIEIMVAKHIGLYKSLLKN